MEECEPGQERKSPNAPLTIGIRRAERPQGSMRPSAVQNKGKAAPGHQKHTVSQGTSAAEVKQEHLV